MLCLFTIFRIVAIHADRTDTIRVHFHSFLGLSGIPRSIILVFDVLFICVVLLMVVLFIAVEYIVIVIVVVIIVVLLLTLTIFRKIVLTNIDSC